MPFYETVLAHDTHMDYANPDANSGSSAFLRFQRTWISGGKGSTIIYERPVIAHDFSGETALTAAAQVKGASIRMKKYVGTNPDDLDITWYRVRKAGGDAEIDEAKVTWNDRDKDIPEAWMTAGANDATDDFDIGVASDEQTGMVINGLWQAWNIAAMIKDAITNRSSIFRARANEAFVQEQVNSFYVRSSEYATAADRPVLRIWYTLTRGGHPGWMEQLCGG